MNTEQKAKAINFFRPGSKLGAAKPAVITTVVVVALAALAVGGILLGNHFSPTFHAHFNKAVSWLGNHGVGKFTGIDMLIMAGVGMGIGLGTWLAIRIADHHRFNALPPKDNS